MTHYIVEADDGSGWGRNGMTFETEAEAQAWGWELLARRAACRDVRVVKVDGFDEEVLSWKSEASA